MQYCVLFLWVWKFAYYIKGRTQKTGFENTVSRRLFGRTEREREREREKTTVVTG
jgi:hypothetical protein